MPSKKWRKGRKRKANLITTKGKLFPFFFCSPNNLDIDVLKKKLSKRCLVVKIITDHLQDFFEVLARTMTVFCHYKCICVRNLR